MKASALIANDPDPDDGDPQRGIDTLPPPHGAKDAYSAQTRVGTLPEHVLEAMRQHETDAALERRTRSGMLRAAGRPLTPPALPSFAPAPAPAPAAAPAPEPFVVAPPQARSGALRSLAVVTLFALLGAICAAALAFAGC